MLIEGGAIVLGGLAWIGKRALGTDATTRRLLRKEPTCAIADLQDTTRAKIVGTARRGDRLCPAPILKTECLAWIVSMHGNLHGRHQVLAQFRGVPMFQLEDESGIATVKGRVETLAIHRKRVTFTKKSDRSELDALAAQGAESRALRIKIEQVLAQPFGKLIVKVGLIEEGDRVAVHGLVTLSVDEDPSGAYRERKLKATLSENRATGLTIAKL